MNAQPVVALSEQSQIFHSALSSKFPLLELLPQIESFVPYRVREAWTTCSATRQYFSTFAEFENSWKLAFDCWNAKEDKFFSSSVSSSLSSFSSSSSFLSSCSSSSPLFSSSSDSSSSSSVPSVPSLSLGSPLVPFSFSDTMVSLIEEDEKGETNEEEENRKVIKSDKRKKKNPRAWRNRLRKISEINSIRKRDCTCTCSCSSCSSCFDSNRIEFHTSESLHLQIADLKKENAKLKNQIRIHQEFIEKNFLNDDKDVDIQIE